MGFKFNPFTANFDIDGEIGVPSSVTDEAIVTWDGTDAKNIQNSTHKITGDQLLAPPGTAAAPPYSFAGQTNTGFWEASGRVFVIANGVAMADFASSRLEVIRPIRVSNGTESEPYFSFRSMINGGLWRDGADNSLNFSHEGTSTWKTEDGPKFKFLRAIKKPITKVATNTTLDYSHHTLLVDASAGEVTITLPAPEEGLFYYIKRIDDSANDVIINVTGGGTIDQGTEARFTVFGESFPVHSDSNEWWIL